jgi:hypothetical protein
VERRSQSPERVWSFQWGPARDAPCAACSSAELVGAEKVKCLVQGTLAILAIQATEAAADTTFWIRVGFSWNPTSRPANVRPEVQRASGALLADLHTSQKVHLEKDSAVVGR